MHRLAVVATAIVIGCAPALGSSQPIHAAPIHSSAAVANQVHPLTVSGSRPQREVFGFVNAVNLGDPSVGYPSWDLSMLTTVAFFGLHVNSGDGQPVTINDTAWNVFHSSTMTNFVNAAHANGVRVIVSLNLHDFSTDPNNQVCQGLIAANAQRTIDWSIREMNAAGIDGINVNYEGTITTCANGLTNRVQLTSFVKNLKAAMPNKYLAIDTFVGSAEDNLEFFDITGLAPYIDGFFVMAYDSDYENSTNPPLTCTSYCMNPVSPLKAYRFNVTTSMAQYTALVPASKVILGQPLYGRAACVDVGQGVAHQYPRSHFSTATYRWASRLIYQPGVSQASSHRDPEDGVTEWDTWWDAEWGCIAEQYYDDVSSLSAKYDLVNRKNLGGVGFFTLDYGGGSPELWAALSTYFSCPVTITLPASETTTGFSVGLSAGSCAVAYFDVEQFDTTISQGWFGLKSVAASGSAGTAIADGFAGHSYQFRARAHTKAGVLSSWAYATTQVATTATRSHAWSGLYTLDGFGGVNFADSPPLAGTAYWAGWSIARTAKALPGASAPQSGFVLDGFGGLHPYGSPALTETSGASGHYWGWDIARDFAFLPDGTGGFVLDGYGGLHPFRVSGTAPLTAQGYDYFGWDIARKVVIFPDGTGGYTLDGWGGVHPFGINGAPPVSKIASSGYWRGWDIARDIVLVPGNGNHSGYVLDGYGGLQPFHPTSDASAMPPRISTAYWGWDIGRGVWFLPGSATAGYTLDGWGGLNAFGGAPAIASSSYWRGWDIARAVWGA
jgi:spore germination protein YaaH